MRSASVKGKYDAQFLGRTQPVKPTWVINGNDISESMEAARESGITLWLILFSSGTRKVHGSRVEGYDPTVLSRFRIGSRRVTTPAVGLHQICPRKDFFEGRWNEYVDRNGRTRYVVGASLTIRLLYAECRVKAKATHGGYGKKSDSRSTFAKTSNRNNISPVGRIDFSLQ